MRTLHGIALDGRAPKLLRYCTDGGVPIYCFAVVIIFSCFSCLQVSNRFVVVLKWPINLATAGNSITYIDRSVTNVFYRACIAQGVDRSKFLYVGYSQPYSSWNGPFWNVVIVCAYEYSIHAPFDFQS